MVYLHCDEKRDDECWEVFTPDPELHSTITLERQRAKNAGWHFLTGGGLDVCPECWPKRHDERTGAPRRSVR